MPTPRDPGDLTRGPELGPEFFRGQARHVARDLVGTLLLVEDAAAEGDGTDEADGGAVGGLVVEAEAYVNAVDPACHLAAGRTPRTEPFFQGPGTIYVYSIHGHDMLNFISSYRDHPEGILIRAIEPTHGRDPMRERRGRTDPVHLASGPGKLTQALGITRAEFDGQPLSESRLAVFETDVDPEVEASRRVGISEAADWPLRFTARESAFVSQPVRTEELDPGAVERAYAKLEDGADLPTVDSG